VAVTNDDNQTCTCFICKNNSDFSMPQEIIEATLRRELVIFAGAGISTESKSVFPYTLYQDVLWELELDENENISFPNLMSLYCEQPNGKRMLYQLIWKRLNYVKSFPEIYNFSTRFHRELSTLHLIDEIVTTNWDDFFEVECGAIPIVNPHDYVYWDLPQRKVFKIHGCAKNISSIVATKEDYKKCLKKLSGNLIGSRLKLLLATKIIVFLGYSFRDEDFNLLYNLLFEEMEGLVPHAYVVTIDDDMINKIPKKYFTTINTDATFFISELKKHIVQLDHMLSDHVFERVPVILDTLIEIHRSLYSGVDIKEHPSLIYTLCFQDGMIHALQRIVNMKNTGEYSCPCCLERLTDSYEEMRREKVRSKDYDDVAYIDGYIQGLYILLYDEDELKDISYFYIYGYPEKINNYEEFISLIESKELYHKGAYQLALKISKKENHVHHRPFL